MYLYKSSVLQCVTGHVLGLQCHRPPSLLMLLMSTHQTLWSMEFEFGIMVTMIKFIHPLREKEMIALHMETDGDECWQIFMLTGILSLYVYKSICQTQWCLCNFHHVGNPIANCWSSETHKACWSEHEKQNDKPVIKEATRKLQRLLEIKPHPQKWALVT